MKIIELKESIDEMFKTRDNESYDKESGITTNSDKDIKRLGYCVNLTLKTVEEAISNKVDVMISHHDAWDFIYGMQEACKEKLEANNIGHYYNHLPLDDCDFGTNERLAKALVFDTITKNFEYEGFYCGRIGEYNLPITFDELTSKMEETLDEPVKSWQFHERKIKKIGIVCGGGNDTILLKNAFENDCDVYVTGEKTLYTVQYAQFVNMNLIVASHTFIELLGIEGLAKEIKSKHLDIEIVRLNEEHIE